MKIGVYRDQIASSKSYQIKGEVVFSPLAEMMSSMHVICNPAHHVYNQKWMKRVEEQLDPALIEKIRNVGVYTAEWLIPLDIAFTDAFLELELMDSLYELKHLTYLQIQKIFTLYEAKVTNQQLELMRQVLTEYATVFFQEELRFLQPVIVHELRKIYASWHEIGIADSLKKIHERLLVTEEGVTYRKQRDHFHAWKDTSLIQYTASIFMAPHLIMGLMKDQIFVTKCFHAEKGSLEPPTELVNKYHALGDPTRLKILKLLRSGPDTTQNLAKKLGISEAAVSKQLKLLTEASFVSKKRESFYQYYSIEKEALEFMTYTLFEYL